MARAALRFIMENSRESYAVKNGFDVPVALFNFNRPQMTRQVFEVVRQIKPRKLLLVADGPRESRPDDVRLCAEVRAVLNEIDWDCEVSRNFSDINLGSFKRNSSGLNWVFDTVEEAIILEDDCIPALSFFPYCEELLERYRDDSRVGVISGNNFVPPRGKQSDASYFFSTYALTWGWASWRRVWKQVDLSMSWWESDTGEKLLSTVYPQPREWQYWYRIYEDIHNGYKKNAWDYQIILSSILHSQLCAVPSVNLISNVGHGKDATNCFDESSPLANLPCGDLAFPLKHPVAVSRSKKMDHAIFKARFDCYRPPSLRQRLVNQVIKKVVSMLPATWKANLKNWKRSWSARGN